MIKFNPRVRARYRLARRQAYKTGRVITEEARNSAQLAVDNYKKVGEVGKEVGRNVKTFMTSDKKVNSLLGPKIKAALETAGPFKYAPLIPVPGATEVALAGVGIEPFLEGARNAARRIINKTYSESMIKFRQKEYTILSGKYDGPKDMEDVPSALSVVGKATLAGAGIGGVVGYGANKLTSRGSAVDEISLGIGDKGGVAGQLFKIGANRLTESSNRTGFVDGAIKGAKVGLLAGIGMKMLVNTMHNPMSIIKYQEVDRLIRQLFGIISVNGLTVGDTAERRGKMDDKFSFNDLNILSYKINVAIQDGKFTMYLLKLSDRELEDLNKVLDYYCKKYFGMSYISTKIGNVKSDNSYSVEIIFTNYSVIANFLSEVSDRLMCKVNLLNNKAVVEEKTKEELEKTFSIPAMDKMEVLEFFTKNGVGNFKRFFGGHLVRFQGLSETIMYTLIDSIERLSQNEKQKILPVLKGDLNNKYLETAFNNSGLIEGMHYTVSKKNCPVNIYLSKGTLIISSNTNSPEGKKAEKLYTLFLKDFYSKTLVNNGLVTVYTYGVVNKLKLELLLKKMVGLGIKPNVLVL